MWPAVVPLGSVWPAVAGPVWPAVVPLGDDVAVPVHSKTANTGSPAPDFELPDAGGELHHLSELLAEGPVVLVFLRGFL